jgi:acyl transferase domain-containing protein/3-hydroxymyristoyl/3-hydroxydecanoyl-(acyl carrier protein) dehydratase
MLMKNKVDKIAIVSISGIFPGAENLDVFLNNIQNKEDAIIEVPKHRWILPKSLAVSKQFTPDTALCSKAGLITDFSFDAQGFLIDKDFLNNLDFTQQLALHTGRLALQNCYTNDEILKRCGVILAAISLPTEKSSQLSFDVLFKKKLKKINSFQSLSSQVLSFPAAILARSLGLQGGCYTLDAACASSLYSIKLACVELLQNNVDMMVAGGVSRPDSLYTQIGFSQLQALSLSGKCSPFDSKADGLVVGEGAGIIVLKRLRDAIACGDKIHGIIAGFGLSNDIEGNLVAPASEGQIRALNHAYSSAGWSLAQVQYIECHGSATPVGDNVELNSMISMENHPNFADIKSKRAGFTCAIGSVKSMTGHLLTAAGAVGMIKTLLAMENKFLPPSLNFLTPPENSPLNDSCFKVQTKVEEWKTDNSHTTRKFGISGFGFGGINAHMLVEEYDNNKKKDFFITSKQSFNNVPIAIVGMETITGSIENLKKLKKIFIKSQHPAPQWSEFLNKKGFFLKKLPISDHEFHIPPNQINDILANQLIMLKTAKMALIDAGINDRPKKNEILRKDFGAAIGIEFDYKATNFFLRWKAKFDKIADLDSISPPLTATRTLGALGGIVASRIAREFKFGGPCFTVSAGNSSGLKAIDIGVKSLISGETNIFLCGCVDMASDIRQILVKKNLRPFKKNNSDNIISEGAGAVVLKTLAQAQKDNDKIYGVIKGSGSASAGELSCERDLNSKKIKEVYQLSLRRCLKNARINFEDIDHYELNSKGNGQEDKIETDALKDYYKRYSLSNPTIKYESANLIIGDTNGVSSFIACIKSALLLDNKKSTSQSTHNNKKRSACIASITDDGACSHILIEEYKTDWNPVKKQNINQSIIDLELNPDLIIKSANDTAKAHDKFLELTKQNMLALKKQFKSLTEIASFVTAQNIAPKPLFNREQCLEFAIGKASNVLGEKFDIVDTYPVRVRLPAEPLMLVDRIMKIDGKMLSLQQGKIITQHDVLSDAWYLDGGKVPVSISIEAGQADLFLSSYLGIDHKVKGIRSYRLLDAKVTFHRTLPEPGDTIEYHIEIDRFLHQGEVYLFFFHYKGYINNQLLISMRDGCAGFFTPEEVENSGGIKFKKEEIEKLPKHKKFKPPLIFLKESYDDHEIEALRGPDIGNAFGNLFKTIKLGKSMRLPGGRMHLIDRVTDIDLNGGRFGLGSITAEADIKKNHWFLTCHFIDDMVMPGTLMYECCSHALRIFTLRMGWVSEKDNVFYDIIENVESDLKCRGPVTIETKKAGYFIEVKEIGYNPEPYIIADAHMYSDDLQIVFYKNMGIKLKGLSQKDIEQLWKEE